MCGFARVVAREPSPTAKQNMLSFASDYFQNALDMGWPVAKGAFKVILCEMEAGRLTWEDLPAVQALRSQYAQRHVAKAALHNPPQSHPNSHSNQGNAPSQPSKPNDRHNPRAPCPKFQLGTCPLPSDHTHAGLYYRHICAFCLAVVGRAYPHPEQECLRKKGQPKGPGRGATTQSPPQ